MKYFLLGAAGYPALEILWRGRTHLSMALAGALSATMIHQIGKLPIKLIPKAALCGIGITCIEAGCGMLWNKEHQVWDYRKMPLNWNGQMCLPYSLIWSGLSIVILQLDKALSNA